MKLALGRWLLLLATFGLLGVGVLLLTNHWGVAIKVIDYLFFIFLFGVVYEIIFLKK